MSTTVLVVDDDPVSIRLLQIILERIGFEVVAARTGAAGLELAATVNPIVVIIDDMMPGMTGGEMCRQIKSNPDLQTLPVILISAGTRVTDHAYLQRVGADYALEKPVLPKDVQAAIEAVLR